MSADLVLCRQWITSYMRPSKYVNHMHGEVGLRLMMQADTGVSVSRGDFRALMAEAGFQPANQFASEWEFRISSAPLRKRPKARVGGWGAAMNADHATRYA